MENVNFIIGIVALIPIGLVLLQQKIHRRNILKLRISIRSDIIEAFNFNNK